VRSKKRIETITQTQEVWIIRRPQSRTWCVDCVAEAVMLTPEEAAILSKRSLRAIHRLREARHIHFRVSTHGGITICLTSLLQSGVDETHELT
jgi:hypothetical protein